MSRQMLILALAMLPCSALAGFSIEGSPTVSTEHGEMGRHAPHTDRGRAAFRPQEARPVASPARYSNAELLVDLAYTPVTETGSGASEVVEGFGDDIPFADCMALILPAGWQLYRNKELAQSDVPQSLSFTGGKPWPQVLKQVAERNGLHFHIDWYQRTIEMSKGRDTHASRRIKVIPEPAPAPARPPQPVVAARSNAASASAPASAVASAAPVAAPLAAPKEPIKAAPATPAPPREVRLVIRQGYLSDNLIRLSKDHGWETPEWRIENADFSIRSGYTIAGKDFAEAISKLLMLHPVEAEVNTSTRKVTVIKEAR